MFLSIPDGLVCLTFDDGVKSQHTFVAPVLEEAEFGATFYISEGLRFLEDKTRYMTWEEVADLNNRGFEIGNHTRAHKNVNTQTDMELLEDITYIDQQCQEFGIRKPTTFCYPGYSNGPEAVSVLRKHRFEFARRGTNPEYKYDREGGRGPAYTPSRHDPLLIPTTGAAGPNYSVDDFKWSVDQAVNGKVCVLTLHGVPDFDHAWVHTQPETFEAYVRHLKDNNCKVIALRDLKHYDLSGNETLTVE
ncbi:MAG: polysaccharide deacetylase family protein [Candidatus Latescibacterota bacterium]|nr:polysaccharide deacetylase family protein [Candidatus Latescibacterota bacterium]